jgi:hypothetical protein
MDRDIKVWPKEKLINLLGEPIGGGGIGDFKDGKMRGVRVRRSGDPPADIQAVGENGQWLQWDCFKSRPTREAYQVFLLSLVEIFGDAGREDSQQLRNTISAVMALDGFLGCVAISKDGPFQPTQGWVLMNACARHEHLKYSAEA